MDSKLKINITIFQIFCIISIVLVITFLSIRSNYPFSTIERAIYATVGYIPFALLGIVILVKPHLPIRAFMTNKKEIKPKDYRTQRILGMIWILFSIISIIDAWSYVM